MIFRLFYSNPSPIHELQPIIKEENMTRILVLFITIFTIGACGTIEIPGSKCEVNFKKPGKNNNIINAKIAQWFDNHSAAISISRVPG
jgi:hypothetical protein